MSKIIAELLGVQNHKLAGFVERLEHASLRPGVDVRLGVEIAAQTRAHIKALSLDAQDTTARELFFVLKHKLSADDVRMKIALSLHPHDHSKNTEKLAIAATNLSARDMCLGLTSAGTKRILKSLPPKKTLKLLKYRSLDSVIKRQDSRVLYALACVIENETWHSQVRAKIRRLNTKDITWQPVVCLPVSEQWYERLGSQLQQFGGYVVNNEAGVVCVLPVSDAGKPGSSILHLGLCLQAATMVATHSIPYRRQSLSKGFSEIVPKIAEGYLPELRSIHGLPLSWKLVHQLTTGNASSPTSKSEVEFETFDLFWQSTETKLASIVPDMDFWVGTHFLGVKTKGNPVSLHVLDVAAAVVGGAEFRMQPIHHLRASLWNELHLRYMQEDVLMRSLLQQLGGASSESVLL